MSGVHFTNCGTNLTTLDSKIINSTDSPIYFQQHAAVLVLADIASVTIKKVTITKYNGFAIEAVNLPHAAFNHLVVSYSQNTIYGIGRGILIFFFDHKTSDPHIQYQVNISSFIFHRNTIINDFGHVSHPCAAALHCKQCLLSML